MKHHPGSSTDKHNASLRRPASRILDRMLPLGVPGLGKQARRLFSRIWARPSRLDRVERANRADYADHEGPFPVTSSAGGWSRTEYGEYYATSVPVYAAIKMRADALARTPAAVYRRNGAGERTLVAPDHPVRQLLDRVNRWYSRSELWQATEIYLNLWGAAFWAVERDQDGRPEIWPLRPDRTSVVPDRDRHVRGFVYQGRTGPVAYTPDEVVWMRYFNPMEEFAGLSPIAPARMAVDMGRDGLRFNRSFLRNSAQPDFVLLTNETMNDNEIEDFYRRWEARFRGPSHARRPAVASFVRDIKTLGMSHRDMDFIQGLRWSLEEVSRAYGVPKPLLGDLERATFSNVNAAERFFWRNTMVPEMQFLAEQVSRKLFPLLGYPGLELEFDLTAIEALGDGETARVNRESQMLDRGVLTINEVRRSRNLPDVSWGDEWAKAKPKKQG